jgi:hypothetical protein
MSGKTTSGNECPRSHARGTGEANGWR